MTISGISRRWPAICATRSLQIRRLTGISGGTEFLLVRAANVDGALQTEESLEAPLTSARRDGAIRGFQSLAQFVPSVARQRDNRALVNDKLMRPYLASYYQTPWHTGRHAKWRRQQGFPDPRCNQ